MPTPHTKKEGEKKVKLNMTFEEAMKKALSTPLKKAKTSKKSKKK